MNIIQKSKDGDKVLTQEMQEEYMNKKNTNDSKCKLCDELLTNREICNISPYWFIVTCSKHDKYATWSQTWMALKELGLEYKEPEHKCQICDANLTFEQFNLVTPQTLCICCDAHKEFEGAYNIERAREDAGYGKLK